MASSSSSWRNMGRGVSPNVLALTVPLCSQSASELKRIRTVSIPGKKGPGSGFAGRRTESSPVSVGGVSRTTIRNEYRTSAISVRQHCRYQAIQAKSPCIIGESRQRQGLISAIGMLDLNSLPTAGCIHSSQVIEPVVRYEFLICVNLVDRAEHDVHQPQSDQ